MVISLSRASKGCRPDYVDSDQIETCRLDEIDIMLIKRAVGNCLIIGLTRDERVHYESYVDATEHHLKTLQIWKTLRLIISLN